jgi:alcohol dehydrogenase class IV
MRRVSLSLGRAFVDGSDREARTDMAFASLLGGLALANAGLGIVHGFAAPIGGMFDAPHGAVCAALLPHGIAVSIRALRSRAADGAVLSRYAEVAAILCDTQDASPEDAITCVTNLCSALEIPPLRAYGMTAADIETVAQKAANASSMKANPIVLTHEELTEALHQAL